MIRPKAVTASLARIYEVTGGYVDGQIYFLKYGFNDPLIQANSVRGPDKIISIQVYSQQPDIEDITGKALSKILWDSMASATVLKLHRGGTASRTTSRRALDIRMLLMALGAVGSLTAC